MALLCLLELSKISYLIKIMYYIHELYKPSLPYLKHSADHYTSSYLDDSCYVGQLFPFCQHQIHLHSYRSINDAVKVTFDITLYYLGYIHKIYRLVFYPFSLLLTCVNIRCKIYIILKTKHARRGSIASLLNTWGLKISGRKCCTQPTVQTFGPFGGDLKNWGPMYWILSPGM